MENKLPLISEQERTGQQTAGLGNGGPIRKTRWSIRFTRQGSGNARIAFAIDLADSKAGGRWAAPTGWPIRR